MGIESLSIWGVRNLRPLELQPDPGLNWFQGANGAGKTSVLEAIHILARGRSFRSQRLSSVIQHGQDQLRVVARRRADGRMLGMERSADSWRGRIDGADCQRLSEFATALPLVLMEPDSHRLVDAGPEYRRHYLDWQLFHVEHDYLETWRRYARYLRQRNAALKAGASDAVLAALERPMIESGERINAARLGVIGLLAASVNRLAEAMGLRLPGDVRLSYRPGHPADQVLSESLPAFRGRDRELGYTRRGPHRAELVLLCGEEPAAQELSRGQQKVLALTLLLAKLDLLADHGALEPVLLLDDPVSELDDTHLNTILAWLRLRAVQTWITATTPAPNGVAMFHVEQGQIERVV